MKDKIIAAIAAYLEQETYFSETLIKGQKTRQFMRINILQSHKDFCQEIAAEIAAAIAPLVEAGEVAIKDLQVGAKVKIIAKIDTSDRFSHHFQIGHLGTITRVDLSDPLYQYLIDDHNYGWVLAEEIELI